MIYDYVCSNCGYTEEYNIKYEDRLDVEIECPKCDELLKYTVPCPKVCEASIPDNVAAGRFNSVRATRALQKAKRKARRKGDRKETAYIDKKLKG